MKIKAISIKRKILFSRTKKHWTKPCSIEAFILKYVSYEERDSLLKAEEEVRFYDQDNTILDYKEGLKLYKQEESLFLEYVLQEQEVAYSISVASS